MVKYANEIFTNLWLGDIRDSRDSQFISKIDVIINCTNNIPYLDNSKECFRVGVEDNLKKNEIILLYKLLDPTIDFIHEKLKSQKSVFVHCYAGKQRSASVICAYLMKYLDFNLDDAKYFVKSKRAHIFTPVCNFNGALKLYEKKNSQKNIYI